MSIVALTGRVLFALIFILSGISHFLHATIEYAASQGVPMASFLVPLSGAIAVAGGLSIAAGYRARWGAILIVVFLIPVTLSMHKFWTVADPAMHQMQMAHFMKNVALLGAALLISYFGSGPLSVDNR
jgi:putative oxidoreductase